MRSAVGWFMVTALCNRKSKSLEQSFTRLADFSRPPMLVNCKDPLVEEGFRCVAFWMWMI